MTCDIRIGLAALLATTLLGCGSDNSVATGKVTYQGKLLVCGKVSFHFDDNTVFDGGISTDGTYYMPSAGRGRARVTVTSPKPQPMPALNRGDPPDPKTTPDANKWFEIPAKYASPETSGKEVKVGIGQNTIDIVLD